MGWRPRSRLFPAMTATRMTAMAMMARENASRPTSQNEHKGKQLFHTTLTLEKPSVHNSQGRCSKRPATAAAKSFKPNAHRESGCFPFMRSGAPEILGAASH